MQATVLPWRYDAEMGTANSLHASTDYGEYNERFGLVYTRQFDTSVTRYSTVMKQTIKATSQHASDHHLCSYL